MCECWAYQQCHVGIRCKGPSQKKKQEVSSSWKENSMIVCGISAKWEVELREAGTQAELRSSGVCEPREWAELCHAGDGEITGRFLTSGHLTRVCCLGRFIGLEGNLEKGRVTLQVRSSWLLMDSGDREEVRARPGWWTRDGKQAMALVKFWRQKIRRSLGIRQSRG